MNSICRCYDVFVCFLQKFEHLYPHKDIFLWREAYSRQASGEGSFPRNVCTLSIDSSTHKKHLGKPLSRPARTTTLKSKVRADFVLWSEGAFRLLICDLETSWLLTICEKCWGIRICLKKEITLHQENQMALQKLDFSLGGHSNNSAAALTPNYPPRQSSAGSCNPTSRNCSNAKTIKVNSINVNLPRRNTTKAIWSLKIVLWQYQESLGNFCWRTSVGE